MLNHSFKVTPTGIIVTVQLGATEKSMEFPGVWGWQMIEGGDKRQTTDGRALQGDYGDPNRFIQNSHPFLNAEQREFLISGLTPEEWAEVFAAAGEEDELDEECDECGEVLDDCTCGADEDEDDDTSDPFLGDERQDANNYQNRY